MTLVYAPLAQQDILEIGDYVANFLQNKTAGKKIIKDIVEGCSSLKEQPQLGMSFRERTGWNFDFRYLVVGNYLVFYKVVGKEIRVYRVLDSRTDYIKKLIK